VNYNAEGGKAKNLPDAGHGDAGEGRLVLTVSRWRRNFS